MENERCVTDMEWSQAVLIHILPALLLGIVLYICPKGDTENLMFQYCPEVKPTILLISTTALKVGPITISTHSFDLFVKFMHDKFCFTKY